MAVDHRSCTTTYGSCIPQGQFLQPTTLTGAFEDYRYDALGRRVQVRTRMDNVCEGTACVSSLMWVVWDGNQIAAEIRGPGGDGLSPDSLEAAKGDGAMYGTVEYVNGPTMDEPLEIQGIVVYRTWRGLIDGGDCMTGTCGSTGMIDYPGLTYEAYLDAIPSTQSAPLSWHGSLFAQGLDEGGLMYRRNRYYDPNTGQFTQEDPIGLAGGMNLYGFASGDPVNFSDPFGLCPVTKEDPTPCDNPSTAGAFGHYIRGSGTPLTRDFATINTAGVKASQFAAVKGRLSAGESGTFEVDGKMGFDTKDLVDGNITLRLQGSLTTQCDQGVCAYSFKGTLGAYDDPYDFNAAHRSKLGEFLTGVGRHTPGKDYMIQIKGKKDVNESGTSPP